MVEAIRKGLHDNIQETTWLDEMSRTNAIKKLKNISTLVAVPDAQLNIQTIENSYKDVININILNQIRSMMAIFKQ